MTPDQAQKQADVLKVAAEHSPDERVAGWLRALSREWEHAAQDADGTEGRIIPRGSVGVGMRVFHSDQFRTGYFTVRAVSQGGVKCFDDEDGRTFWIDLVWPHSPVVVA